ncbi:MAG: hypothetical protein ACT4OF_05495 [Caulobacteraceae bacterium]
MNDWSAEPLAQAIERRRGRLRRESGPVRAGAAASITSWSDREWASQFTFLYGHKARARGVTQVCVRDTDGEIMWQGGVRELELHADPWIGYAWMVREGERLRFESALHGGAICRAADAVRSRL